MKRIFLPFVMCVAFVGSALAQSGKADFNQVIPKPMEITSVSAGNAATSAVPAKSFVLSSSTVVRYDAADAKMVSNAKFLQQYIKDATGIEVAIKPFDKPAAPGQKHYGMYKSFSKLQNAIVLRVHDGEHMHNGKDAKCNNEEGMCLSKNKEAYKMMVAEKTIVIDGGSDAGVFYGLQTLRKALPVAKAKTVATSGNAKKTVGNYKSITVPACQISDAPRFAWRGMMLDCSRHFWSVEEVKQFIDILALHNCNTFHWHLSDDQGWRIEIKKYPNLTKIGSMRKETVIGKLPGKWDGKPYGGFYTQEQAKEIVKYAAERFITIVPEIDMPGHMTAAIASYPLLSCSGEPRDVWTQWGISDGILCVGKETTFEFVKGVLDELMEIFPGKVIHIGGDECPESNWEKCPLCQKLVEKEGYKTDAKSNAFRKLQYYFTGRIDKYLASKGREIIGWDEIQGGDLAKDDIIMSWQGEVGGMTAVRNGHDAVMAPNTYLYFDYYQAKNVDKEPFAIGGYIPVRQVYSYEPVPSSLSKEESKHIRGLQANLWTEYIPTFQQAEYMILPRLAALCEVQWSQPQNKNYESFLLRMNSMRKFYDLYNYNYAKHIFDGSDK
ncbi:MAG: beta-N-acetylhexosaminidase [Bacteroidales bacterium]|jgi:hexosaminidase|nr:beta-N-acetylhexosaminidase [Bacteroidales bacterium]MCI1733465.1 beta-N-acetylhexosaminidase [Bacteroidales bacterium]